MITHIGQRVQPMYAPQHRGVVSQLTPDGFLVTYDWQSDIPRKRGQRRDRYRYPISAAPNFVDETDEEIRILESEDDGIDIDVPESLRKLIGEPTKNG